MTKKRTLLNVLAVILILAITMATMSVPAFARGLEKTDPYGFIWLDQTHTSAGWNIQYYVYDRGEGAYYIEDRVTLRKNTLYDADGDVIATDVKSFSDEAKPTAIFDDTGKLYFLSTDGELRSMWSSTDDTYAISKNVVGSYFVLDENDLGDKVRYGSNKELYLKVVSFTGNYDRDDDDWDWDDDDINYPNLKKKGYVKTYAVDGNPEKIGYDAYNDGKLILTVYCRNSNVWLDTFEKLLSETCAGAKFVGYSTSYQIILYDVDGTLYYFNFGEYDIAYPVVLGEEIYSFEKDENGFIKKVVTERRTYNLGSVIDQDIYEDDYVSKVVNSTTRSYSVNGDGDTIGTLKVKDNYLYWNGDKMSNSKKPTFFGITEENLPVWINSSGSLYYYEDGKVVLIKKNVTRLQYDTKGRAYKYYVGSKGYDI